MVDRSVIKSKISVAEVHLSGLRSHRGTSLEKFRRDATLQAALLHHLQIATQACCDIASHIVADEGWEIPGTSKELFDFLMQHRVITKSLEKEMKDLVGLQNLIVHAYDKLDAPRLYHSLPQRRRTIARFLKAIAVFAKL